MISVPPERLVEIAKDLFADEANGDLSAALEKLAPGYSMTWAYIGYSGELFPRKDLDDRELLKNVYAVVGRRYEFKNVCCRGNTVMLELVESYPDEQDDGQEFRTPLVVVLEFDGDKVVRGRHYCDPRVSHLKLTDGEVQRLYQ